MNIGDRIRVARKEARLTQEALARRADISQSAIAQIEQGERTDPHYSTLSKIAEGLGISVGALLGESTNPKAAASPLLPPAGSDEVRRFNYLNSVKEYLEKLDALIWARIKRNDVNVRFAYDMEVQATILWETLYPKLGLMKNLGAMPKEEALLHEIIQSQLTGMQGSVDEAYNRSVQLLVGQTKSVEDTENQNEVANLEDRRAELQKRREAALAA